MTIIRPEKEADFDAVRNVNRLAFGQAAEATLVDALRKSAELFISLVADDDNQVVGHILFTPVSLDSDDSTSTALGLGLAPMAVLPEYQRQGVGSGLVRAGLRECQRVGVNVVVVLGHPEYYPRFGFVPASQKGLTSEYPVADEVFMAIELEPGALKGRRGLVKYRPEFAEV